MATNGFSAGDCLFSRGNFASRFTTVTVAPTTITTTENKENGAQVTNFIRNIIDEDLARNANRPRLWCGHPAPYGIQAQTGVEDPARIRTRFPPEPNGYLHIGHAKSICLNFGLARDYGGYCHLRFDDTNPVKEDQEYVDSIKESVQWLGFDWKHGEENNLYFASDYFQWMYDCAEHLVKTGFAYVDEQTPEEMHANRGTLTEPGKNSPYRDRPIEENLRLFREMREGKHAEGSMVVRAKIDMASPNINLRDPAIYRIRFAEHHRTGDKWCIYPMYTFAHPIEDTLENITHSICTLEFEDQRAFYDWALERSIPVLRAPQFEEAKETLLLELDKENRFKRPVPAKVNIGLMIEVPSVVFQLEEILEQADFISVGTNDLSQFFFACDRGNPRLTERYDVLSAPFLRLMHKIVTTADAKGVYCSVCGEMASNPIEAMALIGLGFRNLSSSGSAYGRVKSMIRTLDVGGITDYVRRLLDSRRKTLRPQLIAYAYDHGVEIF